MDLKYTQLKTYNSNLNYCNSIHFSHWLRRKTRMYIECSVFNLYEKCIIKKAVDDWDGEITLKSKNNTNLRYAHDTTALALSEKE